MILEWTANLGNLLSWSTSAKSWKRNHSHTPGGAFRENPNDVTNILCLSPSLKLPMKLKGYLRPFIYRIYTDTDGTWYNSNIYQSYYRKLVRRRCYLKVTCISRCTKLYKNIKQITDLLNLTELFSVWTSLSTMCNIKIQPIIIIEIPARSCKWQNCW